MSQLAWIVEKFKTWSDCNDLESSFTKDELLDNVMVYWLNAAAASSARLYWARLPLIVPDAEDSLLNETAAHGMIQQK